MGKRNNLKVTTLPFFGGVELREKEMQLHWVPDVTRTKHSTRQFYKICIALNKTRCCVNAFLLKPKDGHQTAQYAQQFLVIGIEKGNRQVKEASWKTQPCIPQWAGWENFLHMNEYFCPLVCVFIFLNYTHEKCRPSLSISPAVPHCLTVCLPQCYSSTTWWR